jgi:hypothetical protein
LPSGWTQFVGARSKPSSGAKFDLTKASLEVGDSEFIIPDLDEQVTSWLSTNDASLAETWVVKRQGLIGENESTYLSSYWRLEDYTVDGLKGGGYRFMLTNAFKAMNNAIYEDFDGEIYSLGTVFQSSDSGCIFEDISDDAVFRVPGFLLFVDRKTHEQELVYYTTRMGRTFSGFTRNYFGVGASNPSDKIFNTDDTDVYHVWVKRGSPVDILMEWLTTSDATEESSAEQISNGSLDNWTSGVPDDWDKFGTIAEETTIVHTVGGSSVKLASTVFSSNIYTEAADYPELLAGKGYYLDVWIYVEDNGNDSETIKLRIHNVDQSQTWKEETRTWETYDSNEYSQEYEVTRFDTWIKYHFSFATDSSFNDTDNYSVVVRLEQQTSAVAYVDDVSLYGPFDKAPNGPYDLHNGDGVAVPYQLVNFDKIYEIRDTLWPTPTFDATTGNKDTGTAVLFVEFEPIDDLKDFAELHILLPFGLKPLVDSRERFIIDRYHDFFPTETTIGDKWIKKDFKASRWRRNFNKVINNATLLTDYDIERGKHIHATPVESDISVANYGKSKPLVMECRGGRTGRLSFPDYASVDDVEVGWLRIALETSNPWTELSIDAFYEFRDLSQVDAVILNVPSIPDLENGVRGLSDQRFFVDSKKIDEVKGRIVLTVRQRREPFRPSLIAPTGTLDYSPTRPDDLVYCFVGNSASPSNPFGDGTDFYRVI